MSSSRARCALLAAALLSGACNSTIIVRTDGPFIAENGISVPVPPPSLTAEPVQEVDIEGRLGRTVAPDTIVYLFEGTMEAGHFVFADEAGHFAFDGVALDLSDNCIELWYQEPGKDDASEHSFFVAEIAEDDQSVRTTQYGGGC